MHRWWMESYKSGEIAASRVLNLVMVELWLEQFIERKGIIK